MTTTIDSIGNAHVGAGAPGAGQFTRRQNAAPATSLAMDDGMDEFYEQEWRDRMEAVIAEGEPEPADHVEPSIDLFDRSTWAETPF